MHLNVNPATPQYQNYNNASLIQADVRIQQAAEEKTSAGVRQKSLTALKDCETCKNRTYQDQSADGGVSMQSPTKLSPEEAASAVRAHESEHAFREASRAKEEGRDVISNTIRLFTAVCPECGKVYVSGGETKTVTANRPEEQQGLLSQPQRMMDILI